MMAQDKLDCEKERVVRDESRFSCTQRVVERRVQLNEAGEELEREERKANREERRKTWTLMDAMIAKTQVSNPGRITEKSAPASPSLRVRAYEVASWYADSPSLRSWNVDLFLAYI